MKCVRESQFKTTSNVRIFLSLAWKMQKCARITQIVIAKMFLKIDDEESMNVDSPLSRLSYANN